MTKERFTMQKKLHRFGEMAIEWVSRLLQRCGSGDELRDVQISISLKPF